MSSPSLDGPAARQARPSGAVLVSIGDELLAGRVLDTNAHWLSGELRRAGFPVRVRVTVADDVAAIADAVRTARQTAAVVVVGGGLGPTLDDVTREGIAGALGVPLVRDDAALAFVRALYERRGRPMPAGSDVQADLPRGTAMIPNPNGSAPGILCHDAAGLLCVVPGVPAEYEAMVRQTLLPLLATHPHRGPTPLVRRLTISGVPEVTIGRLIAPLMARGRDPVVGSYPKLGRVVLVLESTADDGAARLDADVAAIHTLVGDAVIADDDVGLNEVLARLLIARGVTVAVAESLTGGAIGDGLVEIPGVSAVFLGGVAAYSNDVKANVLGVPRDVLAQHGAVSGECAAAMAAGVRRLTGAALAVAATGIAGPDGGTATKPVGTVCLAVADAAGVAPVTHVIPGDRLAVRRSARERAYDLMRRRLLGLPLVPPALSS